MYTSKFAGQHGFGLYKVLLKPSTGKLQLTKVSGNASGVSGNASYKLSGAKYGIYSDSGCKKLVKTIRTGTNAKVVVSLNTGTYYIKETAPSLGYGLDKTVHKVTIGAGSTSNVTSTEPPNPDGKETSGYVLYRKEDYQNRKHGNNVYRLHKQGMHKGSRKHSRT